MEINNKNSCLKAIHCIPIWRTAESRKVRKFKKKTSSLVIRIIQVPENEIFKKWGLEFGWIFLFVCFLFCFDAYNPRVWITMNGNSDRNYKITGIDFHFRSVIWGSDTLREMIVECQTYWHIGTVRVWSANEESWMNSHIMKSCRSFRIPWK